MHLPHRAGRAVARALVALCLLALALPLLAHAQALDAAAGAATEGARSVSGFAAYLAAATSVLFALSEILGLIPERIVKANGVLQALAIYVPRALAYLIKGGNVPRLLLLALLFGPRLALADTQAAPPNAPTSSPTVAAPPKLSAPTLASPTALQAELAVPTPPSPPQTSAAPAPSAVLGAVQAVDAATSSLKATLGIPTPASVIPPAFWATKTGIAIVVGGAVLGAGVTAAEAYAAVRSATLPAASASSGAAP